MVCSSATVGTSSHFAGTIIALTSIALTTGVTLDGRALARNGEVTLDTNVVSAATCGEIADAGGGTGGGAGGGGESGSGGGGGNGDTMDGGTMCWDVCVDLNTDRYNCGSCGNACSKHEVCVDACCVAQ